MKGPSLQKTTAISAALHATIFLLTVIVLKNSNDFVLPSAYTVNLVSLPGRPAETTSVSPGESFQAIPKMSEPAYSTAVKEMRNTREEQKSIDDSIAVLKSKKKILAHAEFKKAFVSIKGLNSQSVAAVKSTAQATGHGTLKGQASEMTYADKVRIEIQKLWGYPGTGEKNLETVVAIKISKDGAISIQGIEKRSGNRLFDKYALKTIETASPVTPPPYDGLELGITLHSE